MYDFEFQNPTKIIFGKTAMQKIAQNASVFGKKILLAYGQGSIKKNGVYDKVMVQLQDFEVKEFGGIEPNPRVETLTAAVETFRRWNPDLILAVGGGSVIDGSKLISSTMHYSGNLWDFVKNENAEPDKYIPLATVLTVAATGSEMNEGAVITNWQENRKLFFMRSQVFPKFSILDPQNTYSVSSVQTAYGIVDAFSHTIEQYINTTLDSPVQDSFAEGILKTLVNIAPKVLAEPGNYEYRSSVMLAATMAMNNLIGSGVSQDWATHFIEHEISAFYDIPHGAGLAILAPRWMEEIKTQKADKLSQYGRNVWGLEGEDSKVMENAIEKTYTFFKSLGIKMTFREWSIGNEHFSTMVDRLVEKEVGEIKLEKKQIENILSNCL